MDAKNPEALSRGPEYMLAKVANLPLPFVASRPNFLNSPQDGSKARAEKAVAQFVVDFGLLHPGIDLYRYFSYVINFRYHWRWRSQSASPSSGQPTVISVKKKRGAKTERMEQDDASTWCTSILNRSEKIDLGPPPAMEVDFSSGQVRIIPETLLDWLVVQLKDCRHDLAICPREGCTTPYFVKIHPRDKYCSRDCSLSERRGQKKDWERMNRSNGARKRSARKKTLSRSGTRTGRSAKMRKA